MFPVPYSILLQITVITDAFKGIITSVCVFALMLAIPLMLLVCFWKDVLLK
jgi:hypothetical protein